MNTNEIFEFITIIISFYNDSKTLADLLNNDCYFCGMYDLAERFLLDEIDLLKLKNCRNKVLIKNLKRFGVHVYNETEI